MTRDARNRADYEIIDDAQMYQVPMPMRCQMLIIGISRSMWDLKPLHKFLIFLIGLCLQIATWVIIFYVYFIISDYLHRILHALGVCNSISTINIFGCPLIFLHLFLSRDHYTSLVARVNEATRSSLRKASNLFTVLFTILWLMVWAFYFLHWNSFVTIYWQKVMYFIATGILVLPWAIGLCLFAFCVQVYKTDAKKAIESISLIFSSTADTEDQKVIRVIALVNNMITAWDGTVKWFNWFISWVVGAHVVDLILYSCTFWQGNFGEKYPNWQYLGVLIVDNMGILLVVTFAGQLSGAMHQITQKIGSLCVPKDEEGVSFKRIELYQYLNAREETVGMKVAGIRITINIAFAAMVTIVMATTSFTAFIIPRIAGSYAKSPVSNNTEYFKT